MKKTILLLTLLINIFINYSCKSQSKNLLVCKENFKNAIKKFNAFYQQNDTSLLIGAMPLLDKSLLCNETRFKAISIKISILSLLQSYTLALKFIDSLNPEDFVKSYRKGMYLSFFKAKQYEIEGNAKKRNKLLDNTAQEIEFFINSSKSIDLDAYFDLYFIKSLFLKREKYIAELDSLEVKYPTHKEYFEALKNDSQKSIFVR